MVRVFSTGIEAPTSNDRHPSELWWSRMGATTDAAILNETDRVRNESRASIAALRETVTEDYVDRATASQYGIPGPASKITIGTVQGGVTAAASMSGTAPSQTLNLTLPQGPRGPEGPGGSFQMEETSDPGIFTVSDVESEAVVAAVEPYRWNRGFMPTGADVQKLAIGAWTVGSVSLFDSLLNAPPVEARGTAIVEVFQHATVYRAVRWTPTTTGNTPVRVWHMFQFNSGWQPWK